MRRAWACIACLSVLAAAAGAAQTPAPPPQPTGTGLIFGQVLDDATGQPIADAMVSLTVAPLGGRGAGAPAGTSIADLRAAIALGAVGGRGAGPQAVRVSTDSDGRFVFHDLPAGNATLVVNSPGYSAGRGGQTRPNGPARPLELADGERVSNLKIRLARLGVLSGTVVDENGEPAVRVQVQLYRKTASPSGPRYLPSSSGQTDDRGMYRISGLASGDYIAAIPQTQATLPAEIMNSFMRSVANGGGLGAVSSGGGTPAAPAGAATSILDLVSSGVELNGANGVRMGDQLVSSSSGYPAVVGANGRLMAYQTIFYPSAAALSQATPIRITAGGERSGVDFAMRLTPTVRLEGTVLSPAGPISSVGVRLRAVGDDAAATEVDVATSATGPDGRFVMFGVPPGRFNVVVVKQPRPALPAELMANPFMQLAFGGDAAAAPTGVAATALFAQTSVVVGTSDVDGISLVLREPPTVSGRFEFEGTGPKPTAAQLAAATVNFSPTGNNPMNFNGPFGAAPTKLDATGQFKKTPGLMPGNYLVSLGLGAGWIIKSVSAGGRKTDGSIDVKDIDVDDVVVTMTDQIAGVSGRVQAAQTIAAAGSTSTSATPVTALVFVIPGDYRAWIASGMPTRLISTASTRRDGSFTIGQLAAGDYVVAAVDDADLPAERDAAFFESIGRAGTRVTLGDGEKRTIDLHVVTRGGGL